LTEKSTNAHFRIGLKLLASIGCTELLIMTIFRLIRIETWMTPLFIDLTDTLLLCVAASILIVYWVVNPMKILEEREEARVALQKSEARYRLLFENMLEGFAYCRMFFENDRPTDFVYLDVNGAFEKLTGLKNVIGKKIGDMIPGIQAAYPELFEIYGRVVLTGKPERFEIYSASFGGWLDISVYRPEKEHFIAVFDNITERKQTEEAIANVARFPEEDPAPVLRFSFDGTIIYANSASSPLRKLWNSELGQKVPVDIAGTVVDVCSSGLSKEVEVVCGDAIFSLTMVCIRSAQYLNVYGRDITEHKKADDELRLFKNLLNQAKDEIFVVDPATGRYLDINATACTNLGYDREELLKMAVSDIDDIVISDAFSWEAQVDTVKNEGHMFLEGRHRRKNGTTYPVEVNVKYIAFEKRDYMVAVARDITELKRSHEELRKVEKKYKDLFDSTLDGIYQMDADGTFILMNPSGAEMFGYGSPDEIIGRKGLEYWRDPKDRDVFRSELKIKKSVSGYHMGLKKKNGEPVELETSSTLKEDEKGTFLGMEGILRDVTYKKMLEAQLRHSQKMEAIGTLAGGIAHDFNNMLNVIMGYGSMVRDGLLADNPLRSQVDEILAAAERATNLTKQLLVFSRKQVVDIKPIDINETILAIQKMLVRIIRENIEFNLDLAGRQLHVMADVGQIEQVLMNITTNARDAMPEGGRLTIGTGVEEVDDDYVAEYGFGEPGEYAIITVADTGCGMDSETQKKIFEPFFTTKNIGEGTGLGLAISYGIIKQHSGYINVYSELGKGTLFKIYLPLVDETADNGGKTETEISVQGGNETILLAEDDISARNLTKIVLESFGYHVIAAEDGEEAIARFMENSDKIHLAILDMIMPKKNGKEVSEVIKGMSPRSKILFTSGYTVDLMTAQKITELGFDFIHKPVPPKDLLKKVREVLDR